MGELVLVTGTSAGIGLATAVQCARAGHRVIATMRNLERREDLDKAAKDAGVTLSIEHLDVTSSGVGLKIRELIIKYGPLYGLVNNAGIAFGGAFEEQTDDDIREQFETNVFGLMAVTRAVLPAMRTARRGRIINISSLGGRVGLPTFSAYAATKHAVEGFSEALRWELEPFGVSVHLVEPGTMRTGLLFENQRRGALVSREGPYASLHQWVDRLLHEEASHCPGADLIGQKIEHILSDPSPRFRTTIGRDASALLTLRRALPDRVFATGVRFFSRDRGAS